MNKDALLATLIGFGIGLCITAVLLAGPYVSKYLPHFNFHFAFSQPKQAAHPTATPTPTPFGLTISSPLAETIENEKDLLVSGTTTPGSLIVIQGQTDDAVLEVKDDGKYAGKVTLLEGKNDITVTSYLKDKQNTQSTTVYFTPEEF